MEMLSQIFYYLGIVLGVVTIVVLVCNLTVIIATRTNVAGSINTLSEAQAVIILGAGVTESGELSAVLRDRVDTAVAIYRSGNVGAILVSGDNSTTEHNEVVPVQEYLLAQGIPAEDIFLDYAGFDTYDTMYRARAIFEVTSAVVVTQSYHLPRALYLADVVGIEAQGVVALHDRANLYNYAREVLARVKAVGNVLLRSQPEYLGKRIPITGDGRASIGG